MADIAHHAHDLKLFIFRTEVFDVLADRIFAGENIFRGLFVDDRDPRRIFRVVLVEVPATHERHSHCLEVVGCRDPDIGLVYFRAAGPIESARTIPAGKRQPADRRHMLHAGNGRDLLHDLLVELELLGFIGLGGRSNIKYEQPVVVEPGIDLRHVLIASDSIGESAGSIPLARQKDQHPFQLRLKRTGCCRVIEEKGASRHIDIARRIERKAAAADSRGGDRAIPVRKIARACR